MEEAKNLKIMQQVADRLGIGIHEVHMELEKVMRWMQPVRRQMPVVSDDGNIQTMEVTRQGIGPLNTKFGKFWEMSFEVGDRWSKYHALVMADLDSHSGLPVFKNKEEIVVRTDSGCVTGQVFADTTCDCEAQLHLAQEEISHAGEGIVVHIPHQDGRGMGLPFKLGTLQLQDALGVNTVEAARLLAYDGSIDVRTYEGVVAVLKFLGISDQTMINLVTNNPKKVDALEMNGYRVINTPAVVKGHEHISHHLAAKADGLGHNYGVFRPRISPETVNLEAVDLP
ncbi:MAG: ribA [Candidatus Peribacteria bacterium]|nr:ribA [Candidatus Peribacteria bacterium]